MDQLHMHLVGNLSRTELHDLSLSIQTPIYIYCLEYVKSKFVFKIEREQKQGSSWFSLTAYIFIMLDSNPMNSINKNTLCPLWKP